MSKTKNAVQAALSVSRSEKSLAPGGKLVGRGKKTSSTDGTKGGYAVGDKHSAPSGGISGQVGTDKNPILFEGGEAVITAPALSDNKLHEFEGKKMTKRQILSAINQDAGGVAFAKGGKMPKKIRCTGKQYKYGGEMKTDYEIVKSCGCKHSKMAKGGTITTRKVIPFPIFHNRNAVNSGYYQHFKNGGMMARGGRMGVKKYPTMENQAPLVVNEPDVKKEDFPRPTSKHIREIKLSIADRKEVPAKKFSNSQGINKFLHEIWNKESLNIQESGYVLYLNQSNTLIGYHEISRGGITGTVIDIEIIVATASKSLAKSVVISHNHPSGDIKPSQADIALTKQLQSALALLQIRLLDHIIVVPDSSKYYSFMDEGVITYERGGMMAKGGKTKAKGEEGITTDQMISMIAKLRKFVPPFQIDALVDIYRGEESSYAVEVMQQLLQTFETMPKTYQTEKQETDDKIIYLHYFFGGMDWYIVEKDSEAVQSQAFGYADLGEGGEWGYISLVELMQTNRVEIDFNWTPITFGQMKGKSTQEEQPVAKQENDDTFMRGNNYHMPADYAASLKTQLSKAGFTIINERKSFIVVTKKDTPGYAELMIVDNGGEFNIEDYKDRSYITSIGYSLTDGPAPTADVAGLISDIYDDYFAESFRQPETSNARWQFVGGKNNSTDLVKFDSSATASQLIKELGLKDYNPVRVEPEFSTEKQPAGWYAYRELTKTWLTRGVFESNLQRLQGKQDIEDTKASISEIAAANPDRIMIVKPAAQAAPQNKQAATTTIAQQATINAQIRKLVAEKGADRSKYSAADLALLKQYEGAGSEKKTSTDARILDQFFTPMDICAKMWGLAFKHGFNFGYFHDDGPKNILEPAVGSGRFLSFIPTDVKVTARAYDVDEIAVNICKVLYPHVHVYHESFESMFFKGRRHIGLAGVDTFYDLVIGNPPYREYVSKYAPLGEKEATGATTFESYFIIRGVDVLKPGGLLCYIIPNTFLSNDSKYNAIKEKIAKKADLIDAYRLPNGVFGNTDVGTDIILLKKK